MIQFAKTIFLINLSIMKKILDLVSFKFDRRTNEFRYLKSQVMDYFYESMKKEFDKLVSQKILENCDCGAHMRKGYSKCPKCQGSGYKNYES